MKKIVTEYFENLESRMGYKFFLKGAQHFGLYNPELKISNEREAQKHHHDTLVNSLNTNKKQKILDIGCGQGIVATDIAKRYKLKVTGLDLTPYMIQQAKLQAKKNNVGDLTKFKIGNYQEMPFEKDSFDACYGVETLSHATDLNKALAEIYRVVKPNGKCVFFEYKIKNIEKMSKREKFYYELVKEGSSMSSLDRFINEGFEKTLKKEGFTNIQSINLTPMAIKSFHRLYRYALIPYQAIKLFSLQKKFINTTAAVEYFNMTQKGYLNYYLHTAETPSKKGKRHR